MPVPINRETLTTLAKLIARTDYQRRHPSAPEADGYVWAARNWYLFQDEAVEAMAILKLAGDLDEKEGAAGLPCPPHRRLSR